MDNLENLLGDERAPHIMRGIWFIRCIHLFSAPVAIVVAVLLLELGYGPLFDAGSIKVNALEIMFISLALVFMLVSIYWISGKKTNGKWPEAGLDWIISLTRRAGFLWAVTIIGVILAYIGSVWPIWVSLIIIAGILHILTYPSDKRLKKWIKLSKAKNYNSC